MASIELARELRVARERADLSLRDLRDATGLGLAHLHRLEHGRVGQPSPSTLRTLARALDVPYMGLMRLAGYL